VDSVALALVLAAGLFHAAWNVLLHDTSDRVATMAVSGLIGGVVLLPAAVIAPPLQVLPLILLSACAESAYALCLAAAYQRGALAMAYPVGRGVAPLVVTLGGWMLLRQRPSPLAVGAATALLCGLLFVATDRRDAADRTAIAFAVATGCMIALYSLIDARAVQQVSPAGYLSVVLILEGVFLSLWLRAPLPRLRRSLRTGSAVAVGSVAAYLLVLLAFQRANAGHVATVREASVLIGLLLARERIAWRTWTGAALIVAGAIAAAL
jgi:drug/metabolite transporter (DMT)-like permease